MLRLSSSMAERSTPLPVGAMLVHQAGAWARRVWRFKRRNNPMLSVSQAYAAAKSP